MDEKTFLNNFCLRIRNYQPFTSNDSSEDHFCHYLRFVIEGSGLLVGKGVQFEVQKGDMFYIPKGYKYTYYWNGPDSVKFFSLGFVIFPDTNEYCMQKIKPSNEVVDILNELMKKDQVDISSVGLLYTLLGRVVPSMDLTVPIKRNSIVEQATEYMRLHPSVRIPEVAATCGISSSTLYLAFQRTLDKTPNDIRQAILCESAAMMLTTTDLSIEEISYSLGFSSSAYFRKVFRKITGKSPRMYRKTKE